MKVLLDYDPGSGLSEYKEILNQPIQPNDSDVVKLSNNGMTAKDLINLRKSGVI